MQAAAYQRLSAKNGDVATRHHSPSTGPTSATSDGANAASAIVPSAQARTRAMVAYGRRVGSGLSPGISPGRSFGRRALGAARARDRRSPSSGESSFGARLRSRVPQ